MHLLICPSLWGGWRNMINLTFDYTIWLHRIDSNVVFALIFVLQLDGLLDFCLYTPISWKPDWWRMRLSSIGVKQKPWSDQWSSIGPKEDHPSKQVYELHTLQLFNKHLSSSPVIPHVSCFSKNKRRKKQLRNFKSRYSNGLGGELWFASCNHPQDGRTGGFWGVRESMVWGFQQPQWDPFFFRP